MEPEETNELLEQVAQVIDERFAKHYEEAARDLIYNLNALPWELQEKYWEYAEFYHEGKRAEASKAWAEWIEQARELGLI